MSVTALTSDPRYYATPSPAVRTKQSVKRKSFVVTGVYDLLLQGVYAHFLITAEQLNRLYYKPGTITTVKERLKELVDNKYLDYLQLLTRNGSGAYVYFLAIRGRKYLHEAGFDLKGSYRPSEEKERAYQTLMHTLELNECLTLAGQFAREEGFTLLDMRHDFTLRRSPIKVSVKKRVNGTWVDEAYEIVADAWLTFQKPDTSRRWIWLEHDRGSASANKIKKHLRGILAFIASEGYKKEFGASGVTVAYTTSAGTHRMERLRELAREVLTEHLTQTKQGALGTAFSPEAQQASIQKSHAMWFLFTTVPPLKSAPLDAKQLFFGNVWYHPFGNKATAMFRK
jgi:hypothetical protein